MIQWQKTRWLDSIASTQEWIQSVTPALLDTPVCAHHQTAGLGTRGRSWVSKPGDLTFSFGFLTGNKKAHHLLFIVSLAICDALEHDEITIKPPNDLYFHNQKMGGLLIENKTLSGQAISWVGIGVNLQPKDNFTFRASHLSTSHLPAYYVQRFTQTFNQRFNQSPDQLFFDYKAKIPWTHLEWFHRGAPIFPISLNKDLTIQSGSHLIPLSHMKVIYKD